MRLDYYCVVVVGLFLENCAGLDNITNGISKSPDNHSRKFSSEDCDQPGCLRCGPKGCTKCARLIVHPSRACVDTCPFGHVPQWSTKADYVGRLCRHNGHLFGLSADALAVLAGVATGTALCALLVSAAVACARYGRKRRPPPPSEAGSEIDDAPEKRDFSKRLETLRPHAPDYLAMLNDARKQIRGLHREGDTAAISAYRPVVRDLAKVLLLLNRPVERVAMPEDWERLFNWAEKALKRYKRMSESSQPQVAQLINFLQGPVLSAGSESEYSLRGSTTMSTFKPDRPFGSSSSLQDLAIHNFDSNYDSKCHLPLNPQWKFEYSLVSTNNVPSSQFNPTLWKNSKECLDNSLFLEDDFCQLGFRPQDEITTEL